MIAQKFIQPGNINQMQQTKFDRSHEMYEHQLS